MAKQLPGNHPIRRYAYKIESAYYELGDTPREIADDLRVNVDNVVALLQEDTAIAIDPDLPDPDFETGVEDSEEQRHPVRWQRPFPPRY